MSEIPNSGKVWFLESFEEAGNRPYMDGEIVGKPLKKISSNKTWKIIRQLASFFSSFFGIYRVKKCWVNNFFCLTNRADEEGWVRAMCRLSTWPIAVLLEYLAHPTAPLIGRPKSANYLGVAIKYLSVLTTDRWNGSSSEMQCNKCAAFPPIMKEQLDIKENGGGPDPCQYFWLDFTKWSKTNLKW